MAATDALVLRPGVRLRTWAATALVLAVSFAFVRILGVGENQSAQTFALVFTAIVAEALPFVLLGAFAAALIEVYVPDRVFDRIARLPVALQLPAAAAGGFVFPVCECGSVPVARRLISKGVHPSAGLAFMIASPIFNPIVLGSTWVAYKARGLGLEMVLGRAGLGLVLALATGWTVGTEGARDLLRPRSAAGDQDHDVSCCSHKESFVSHLIDDFFYMGKFLVLGAALAATMQALLPQSLIAGAVSSPLVASLALMALAFVSSLCSEADAFVAVSFTPFPVGAQLAFLVFGPVLDFKLFFLYGATFRRRLIGSLAAVAIPVTLAGALWFEVVLR
ncbi:MAG: permease [Actinomycetota bacterium]